MNQMKLVFGRISRQSLRKPAGFPLGRSESFPDPFMVNHGIPDSAPVGYTEHPSGPVAISYFVGVVVAARADPVSYQGCVHVGTTVFRMAIHTSHHLGLMFVVDHWSKGAGRMTRSAVLID